MKTKNLFLAAAILFAGFTTAVAQEVNWGIKAGANYSTISSDMDPDYLFGFHAGVVAEIPLSAKFSLQPELLYSLEGAKSEFSFEEEGFSISSEQEIRLGYINLPVMAKYFVTPALSLQAGPQIGYLVNAEIDYEISSNFPEDFTESGTEDIKDDLKKTSFGVNFGLGYDFSNKLFVQARYHLGLSDISDFEEQDDEFEVEYEEIKNQGFQVSLGYKF